MPVKVGYNEVSIAKKRFEENWSYPTGCESWYRFLGHYNENYNYDVQQHMCIMGDDQARVIRMLNGPHYKTILKMMAVQWREGVEHDTGTTNPQAD